MIRLAIFVVALALAGCGPKGDDCHKMFDKLAPLVEKESGKKPEESDKVRILAQCYDDIAAHKDSLMKCVLDATGDDAVAACASQVTKTAAKMFGESKAKTTATKLSKYAFEAYPSWSVAHPDKACPAELAELNEYMDGSDSNDAWGHPIKMMCGQSLPPGAKGLAVMSMGEDGKDGTCDDLESWDPTHACK